MTIDLTVPVFLWFQYNFFEHTCNSFKISRVDVNTQGINAPLAGLGILRFFLLRAVPLLVLRQQGPSQSYGPLTLFHVHRAWFVAENSHGTAAKCCL
ncbi:uncharacterized protein EV420DRAFT_1762693 [Desarmillaria tabescens]|uniref:Uncharacterized protein n=1 Tax=Armillaria tabescens TaxID=1929756 RepID=A0AA39KFR4_ARMTA|nr:uncharacterized protein EV420DRAFT_1762693 [Desarmillaria tabescens]KAK0460379.1 hypothetical protein EV420DRAFT_1762693 [Desarmillaria tabescens]